jgi:hypothetical protein
MPVGDFQIVQDVQVITDIMQGVMARLMISFHH